MESRLVDVFERAGQGTDAYVLIKGVPAWVCPRCGEQLFETHVAQKIVEICRHKAQDNEPTLTVPVREFASVQ